MKIIQKELDIFNSLITEIINKNKNPITDNISDFINSKSKKLRPCLIFLFAKAMNIKITQDIYNLALATEIIHNATLIHDDIIDDASTRRGNVSLNKSLGNNLSVLTGDLLLSFAIQELNKLKNPVIIEIFSSAMRKMCNGEINQHFSIDKIPTIEEYIEKSQNKTAELFSASLEALCIIADIYEKELIKNFAVNFGIAFQIKDDLKNITDSDLLKPSLIDIYNGIFTAPVILLKKEINNIEDLSKNELIAKLKGNSQIVNKTKKIIEKYSHKAIASIDFIRDNQYKSKLIEITTDLYKAE